MRKPNRTPTTSEIVLFVIAAVVGMGVAIYFGGPIAAVAIAIALAIAGSGLVYTTK